MHVVPEVEEAAGEEEQPEEVEEVQEAAQLLGKLEVAVEHEVLEEVDQ